MRGIRFHFQVFRFSISIQITFGVIVMGRKTETGTEDVVFLLSPRVMSSSFRLCLHKVVAALSIHCHHGYSSASAILPSAEPSGATRAAIGQCVWLTGTLSNGRGCEWCQWKDRTLAEMCIQTQGVRDPLLTHQLNKGGCHISSYLFERNRLGRTSGSEMFYSCLELLPVLFSYEYNQLTQGSPQREATWNRYTVSPTNKHAQHYIWWQNHSMERKKYLVRIDNSVYDQCSFILLYKTFIIINSFAGVTNQHQTL